MRRIVDRQQIEAWKRDRRVLCIRDVDVQYEGNRLSVPMCELVIEVDKRRQKAAARRMEKDLPPDDVA